MMESRGLACCGAAELIGINDSGWTPKKWLLSYCDEYNIHGGGGGRSWMPFSYAWQVENKTMTRRSKDQGTERLNAWKDFILDNKLGRMIIMKKAGFNPNYGKTVRLRAGLWVPDNRAIQNYVIAEGWRKGNTVVSEDGLEW